MTQRALRLLAALAVCGGLFVSSGPGAAPARAANGTVGSGLAASCTAVELQNVLNTVQGSGGGVIDFKCGAAPHTIIVANSLTISSSVTFKGGAQGDITLSGGNARRIFFVDSAGHLTLNNMVVALGLEPDGLGGCILVTTGTLSLNHTTVQTCRSGPTFSAADQTAAGNADGLPAMPEGSPSSGGGAIYSAGGAVTLADSQVLSSSAQAGGGIAALGSLSLVDSRVAGNDARDAGAGLSVGTVVTVVNSLIERNDSLGFGGGILGGSLTQLTVKDSRLFSNTALFSGGGIYSQGALTLTRSHLDQNWAGQDGGGALVFTGTVSLNQAVLDGNRAVEDGGGLALLNGTLAVSGSELTGNAAERNGGAMVITGGQLALNTSRLAGNRASGDGGALWADNFLSTLTLTNVLVEHNQAANGGGLAHFYGTSILNKVTLSSNTASGLGGGYYDHDTGSTAMTNVTISGNSAGDTGGGLHSGQVLTLTNVTLAKNTAAVTGGYVQNGLLFPYLLRNVLLVDNTGAGGADANCSGLTNNGTFVFSLSTDATCPFGGGSDVNAPVGGLQINGGLGGFLLPTHLPLAGSAAIDGGTNSGCPSTDERGGGRPFNSVCDVGAVESGVVLPWVRLPVVLR